MRTRPLPRNFSSGEMAPWVDGITNELTQKGCRTIENYIVKKQGQATRRPGTFFVAEVKDSSKATALVPVVIDDTNRYVLEIGDAYVRVFDQSTHAYLSTEITSPWSTGDVSSLRYQYFPKKKAIAFVHNVYEPRLLSWTSGTDWSLDYFPFEHYEKEVYVSVDGQVFDRNEFGESAFPDESVRVAYDTSGSPRTYVLFGGGRWLSINRNQTGWDPARAQGYFSEDAESWAMTTLPFDPPATNIWATWLWVNSAGTAMMCGGSTGEVAISHDGGAQWASPATGTITAKTFDLVGYDEAKKRWRIEANSAGMYTADDGLSWATTGSGVAGGQVFSMDGYNDVWLSAVGGKMYRATSVAAFTTAISVTSYNFYAVRHGTINDATLWVALAQKASTFSTTFYVSGDNAVTWSAADSAFDARYSFNTGQYINSYITFDGNRFLVYLTKHPTAADSTSLGVDRLSSTDGRTWTVTTVTDAAIYVDSQAVGWDQLHTYFKTAGDRPSIIAGNEGRTVLGASTNEPATLRASKAGELNRFFLGDVAGDSWEYELTGPDNVDIQWIMGDMGGLVVGTRTAEGILLGSPEEGITPLTAQFRWLSTFGSANIQPVRIHDTIVFVQRGGEIIRGYVPSQNAYQSPELTSYADHIASGGVTKLAHQDDPQSMVYAIRNDGQMLALTFDNNLRAWARIKAAASAAGAAVIEDVAIIPTSNAEDEIWLIVKRTIGGSTKRYIEYMDTLAVASFAAAHYVDCGVYKTSGTTFQTVGSLTHLAGEVVDALVDGSRWIAGLTVAASGTITTAPYSGTAIHAGLPYSSYLQTLRGDHGSSYGDGAGLNKRTSGLTLWVHDSSALAKFGPTTTTAVESISYSTSVALATEVVSYPFPGQWDRDNYIWCIVNDPRPFTLVAMLPDSETGDR